MTSGLVPVRDNLPAALLERKQWLLWRFEQKAGEKKPRKVPYYTNGSRRTGAQGSDADRAALVDFDTAMAALTAGKGKYTGLGFAFLPGDGLIGIDLDGMIDGDAGEVSERGANIISACASYTELSPSGKGVHIICTGVAKSFKSNVVGVEVFCGGQFFTVTGHRYQGTPDTVEPLPEKVLNRLKATVDSGKKRVVDGKPSTAPAPAMEGRAKVESALAFISADCGYDDWIRTGMAIHAELGDSGLPVFDAWSARGSKYPGQREVANHWRSFKPGAITGGTIYKLAMDAGWQPPRPPRRRPPAEHAGAGAVATPAGAFVLSEDSLAQRFEAEWKDTLAFAHKFGYWLIQDRKTCIWERDHTERVFHWLREFIRQLNSEQQAKWSKAAVVASVERFARAAPSFARTGDEFDANNWLLGTPAGVIDLRTGAAITPSPTDYVSKRTAVPVGTGTPTLWLAFLEQATQGDAALIGYLQRLCGYCLTGETSEEVLVFMHGPGGNGKGVFMNALRDIMGEYARQAPMQVFLANNGERHPTELANLHGARLVLGSESPEGKRWDEERIKSLTGRDAISARFMNRDFFEFVPRFKLLVASNHKPRIRTVDDAWRRRLHLVPFTVKPEKPDPHLKDRLRAEYPAILNWMLAGAEWWSREGLCPPVTILDATEEYFREEDVIGLWFDECCEDAAKSTDTERKYLYQSFENWCHGMGHAAANMHTVTRWFKQHGYEQASKKATRPIIGVRLKVTGGAE